MNRRPVSPSQVIGVEPAQRDARSTSSLRCFSFLQDVLADFHPRDFAVRCWDGRLWPAEPGEPTRFTLVLTHPGAIRALFLHPSETAVTEAFLNEDCDVEGDLEAATALGRFLKDRRWEFGLLLRHGAWLWGLPSRNPNRNSGRSLGPTLGPDSDPPASLGGALHSRARDRRAVSYHYDASNEFYALWLDRRMIYSCAYFVRPEDSLETAQTRKLDYVCRKLRLKPGDRLLDVGCGWGGLIQHAAERYGAHVIGITLSARQAEWAEQCIRARHLGGSCRVEVCDYRDLPSDWRFDKIVSIGMVEHVGTARLPSYFGAMWTALRPGGVCLNQGIAARAGSPSEPSKFMDRYVFPDSELPPLDEVVREAERRGFHVRDVESLREHYAMTLRHWLRRLEARRDKAVALLREKRYRVWRLYLASCAYGFHAGLFDLYQTLLSKPLNAASGLPLTREDWCRPAADEILRRPVAG